MLSTASAICDNHGNEADNRNGSWDIDGDRSVFNETAVPNPLRVLWESDPKAYKELIRSKAYELIGVYRQIGQELNCDVSEYLKRAANLFLQLVLCCDARRQ